MSLYLFVQERQRWRTGLSLAPFNRASEKLSFRSAALHLICRDIQLRNSIFVGGVAVSTVPYMTNSTGGCTGECYACKTRQCLTGAPVHHRFCVHGGQVEYGCNRCPVSRKCGHNRVNVVVRIFRTLYCQPVLFSWVSIGGLCVFVSVEKDNFSLC